MTFSSVEYELSNKDEVSCTMTQNIIFLVTYQTLQVSDIAVTCDFQQSDILTNVDSDEPVQPLFKLRNSKLFSVSGLTVIEYSIDHRSLKFYP